MVVVVDVDVVVVMAVVVVALSIVENHCPILLEGNINHHPEGTVGIVGSVRRVVLDRSLDSD